MSNESGESMELMEEVPLKELGKAELERLEEIEGIHTGKNNLLSVEKMMWMDERV